MPIVPIDSIAGRALVAVIAIMTFLGALTTGAVVLVAAAAVEWQSAVAREVTIQIRPAPGAISTPRWRRRWRLPHSTPGVAEVQPYTKEESARLLEPWLGSGLSFDDLPVPRLIVVKLGADAPADLTTLRTALAERVAGASLDDHRGWIERMRSMSRTAIGAGLSVLALVFAATMLSVTFATRGAMSTNRPIVEVLHFVGAKDRFIIWEFTRNFLALGLKGGAIGGGSAVLLFACASLIGSLFRVTPEQDQTAALFGTFAIRARRLSCRPRPGRADRGGYRGDIAHHGATDAAVARIGATLRRPCWRAKFAV